MTMTTSTASYLTHCPIPAAASTGSNTGDETAMNTAGFYLEYPNLRDNNFNSWDVVEEYTNTMAEYLAFSVQNPRVQDCLLKTERMAPVMWYTGCRRCISTLVKWITITSIHATDLQTCDVVYTASTTGAITGATTDTELGYVYGIVNGGVAALDTNAPGHRHPQPIWMWPMQSPLYITLILPAQVRMLVLAAP